MELNEILESLKSGKVNVPEAKKLFQNQIHWLFHELKKRIIPELFHF